MVEVFYHAAPLAGLTSSMHCLVPIRLEEQVRPDLPRWPTMAYWRRIAAGVTVELNGNEERLAIGSFRKGNMDLPSIVDATRDAPTLEHREQATIAVRSLQRCEGVLLICHSQFPGLFQDAVDNLRADLQRIGRRLEDIPTVVQATFQDIEGVPSPGSLGALVGISEYFCVPSVAANCIGVREALSLLLSVVRSRGSRT